MVHAVKQISTYGVTPRTVVHIGGHIGQEAAVYNAIGVERAVFVEAIPAVYEELKANLARFPQFIALNAVCSDGTQAEVVFNVSSNNGGSSSFLSLGRHAELYPEITYVEHITLPTTKADDLIKTIGWEMDIDLIVLDTQGAELFVLRGSTALLQRTKTLWIEVSEEPLYEGGATFEEVTAFVRHFGFRLRSVLLNAKGWGDALYVKP